MLVNFRNRKIVITMMLLMMIAAGVGLYKRSQTPGIKINCSTILHYDHASPNYVSSLEMTFRLDKDYEGLVVLFGYIDTPTGRQTIARNIQFDYSVKTPGEITVRNMSYIKTLRDNANDEIVKNSFFFVPEGTERQLRLNPLGNAWLLGNPQSPFALCVNKKD